MVSGKREYAPSAFSRASIVATDEAGLNTKSTESILLLFSFSVGPEFSAGRAILEVICRLPPRTAV